DLNEFLKRNARQNQSNGISKTYVVIEEGNNIVRGFYTISSAEISPLKLPSYIKHPRYPVSAARICRLAVDKKMKGKGMGRLLLNDAFDKIILASSILGIFAIIVDAKDDRAICFYEKYGFFRLDQNLLVLPLSTLIKSDPNTSGIVF
ncbi:MAG: ribosomal protein S18 acetylase RimI-like enzyme, partial [Francisellaceae bacterium]